MISGPPRLRRRNWRAPASNRGGGVDEEIEEREATMMV
jgi:hypothetical protein